MPEEGKSTNGEGGKGPPSGQSNEQLDAISKKVDSLTNVMGDVVTKVSDMERMQTETRDLDAIMNSLPSVAPQKVQEIEPPTSTQTQPDAALNKVVEGLNQQMAKLADRMDVAIGNMDIKFRQMKDPEFDKTVRPEALRISKELGKREWPVDTLIEHAEGRIAKHEVKDLMKQVADLQTKVKDFEGKAGSGEKPSFFAGGEGPPKEMSEDESFSSAIKEAGLENMPE